MTSPAAGAAGLRTPPVRRRLLVAVLVVLVLALGGVGAVVAAVYERQSSATVTALLSGRVQLARQLVQTGVTPRQLLNRVDAQGVRATLTFADGVQIGAVPVDGPRREVALGGTGQLRGARLVLTVDRSLLDQARSTLLRTLVITSLVAMLVAGAVIALVTRTALAPLRRVAAVAGRITAGERGVRLRPQPTRTELGETAQALDAMLDALEGAEGEAVRARRSSEQFLADVAHELRTPLAGARTAAETVLHQELPEAERQQLLALLVRETERAGRLLDELLVAARLEQRPDAPRVPVRVSSVLGPELERLAVLHPGVSFSAPAGDATVLAEPAALQGILRNLLENAVRAATAAPRAARVQLTTTAVPPGPGVPPLVLIDVADSGDGVPPGDRERIFGRLERGGPVGSGPGPGFGLGLAISRRAARALGGDVELPEPQPRAGAVFRVRLPAG